MTTHKKSKVLLFALISLLLTACSQGISQEREEELITQIREKTQEIIDLKAQLKEANTTLKETTNHLVIREDLIKTSNMEIINIFDLHQDFPYYPFTSLMITARTYSAGEPILCALILGDFINGKNLLTDYGSEIKVGDRYKFSFVPVKNLASSIDIARIVDIQAVE